MSRDEVAMAYEEQLAMLRRENMEQAKALNAAMNKLTDLERKVANIHMAAMRVVEVARSRP